MKEIVIINQDSGYLMIDIANTFNEAGYKVILITGRLVQRNIPLHESVRLDKIIKYRRSNIFMRLVSWIVATLQILFKIWFKYRDSHLFIVSNPPLAPLLPLISRNSYSILIFDVYPDAISNLGILSKKSLLFKLWSSANKKSFAKAKYVYTISEGMKSILKKYGNDLEPEVVSIWTDNFFLKPIDPLKNPFIKKYNLTGKFIVLYSGNIGIAGDVDSLIELAASSRRDDVVFLIIGKGARRETLMKEGISRKLKNILFLPWQPVEELPYSLSSASVAVVIQGNRISEIAVPSKFYNYISVGVPILCIASRDAEISSLVAKYDCGKVFESNNFSGMVDYIN
ncbi:MAG TPA: glycosyltransferase WbuB, partial [Caldithrix sp.]|nr:glycosyltransferase WbuB [Caldithrix sp.]